MFKVEIGGTLRCLMQMFHLFGIWRNEEESDFRMSCRRLVYMLQNSSYIGFILICAFLSDDRNTQIFLVDVTIIGHLVVVKLWYLLYRKNEILQFLDGTIVKHCIPEQTVAIHKKVTKILKFINIYSLIVVVSNTVLILASYPMFTSEKILPMFIRFDIFDVNSDNEMILYYLALLYSTLCIVMLVVYNSVTVFIWYIMCHLSIDYRILGNQLRKLGYCATKGMPNSYHQDLLVLLQAHKNIVDTVERFRSCFAKFFLDEMVTGAVAICGSTYNLAFASTTDVFGMIYYAVILFHAVFDIFLIMYLANEITLESSRLSYCLFESNWIEQSESTKKCVIILCEIFKKPHQMTIFIYPMNLEKFVSIVNGAYRMFNILKSFSA